MIRRLRVEAMRYVWSSLRRLVNTPAPLARPIFVKRSPRGQNRDFGLEFAVPQFVNQNRDRREADNKAAMQTFTGRDRHHLPSDARIGYAPLAARVTGAKLVAFAVRLSVVGKG